MFERRRTKRMSRVIRISMLLVFLGIFVMVLVFFHLYSRVFASNVSLEEGPAIFYIDPGTSFEQVAGGLEEAGIIDNRRSFVWVSERKGYDEQVRPGRFKIRDGISNNTLVNMLRSGKQDPVMVVFHNMQNLNQLAGRVSEYLEGDSLEFAIYFYSEDTPARYGFDQATFPCMFIPNTYEFYWTTTPEEFTDRMSEEYESFWKGERDRKAERLGMTRVEVITLASIVDEETLHDDENRRIAGVYINRLEKGIPLQADPTLKFALNDRSRKRILNEDKAIDSPYNTYWFKGLPPGPISIPSISAIDGVLNHEDHSYFYFCAKPDFSGYHAFAQTLSQHNRNAMEYQRALNRNRIYR
ncbi:MAG: endolytic transglycosylase MltG [Bacteroidota bacterium]